MTVAVVLAHLRERLTEGEAAPIPDYKESAIAEIMGSFGEGMVTKAGASNWKEEIKPVLCDAKRTLVVVDREFYVEGRSSPARRGHSAGCSEGEMADRVLCQNSALLK